MLVYGIVQQWGTSMDQTEPHESIFLLRYRHVDEGKRHRWVPSIFPTQFPDTHVDILILAWERMFHLLTFCSSHFYPPQRIRCGWSGSNSPWHHHGMEGRGPLSVQWHWTWSLSSRLPPRLPALLCGAHNALLCDPRRDLHAQGHCPKLPFQLHPGKDLSFLNWTQGDSPINRKLHSLKFCARWAHQRRNPLRDIHML